MGATRLFPKHPKTVVIQFWGHLGYGITTALVATKLGEEGLFNGEIPMTIQAKEKQMLDENTLDPANMENERNDRNVKTVKGWHR